VNEEPILKRAGSSVHVAEIVDSRPLGLDSGQQGLLDPLAQRCEPPAGQGPGRPQGMNTGPEQSLIGVDVADAGDPPLVEDERLHGCAAAARHGPQVIERELGGERLDADPLTEIAVASSGPGQQMAGPEPTRIHVHEAPTAGQLESDPRVGRVARRVDQERARHPQVAEEVQIAVQLPHQILSSSTQALDAPAGERVGDELRGLGPGPSRVEDLDPREDLPLQVGRQLASNRLDFRQLGHPSSA
jgi:hypothetical protein